MLAENFISRIRRFVFCDLFFVNITSDVASYADDTTAYECGQHCDNLISNIELAVEKNFN